MKHEKLKHWLKQKLKVGRQKVTSIRTKKTNHTGGGRRETERKEKEKRLPGHPSKY